MISYLYNCSEDFFNSRITKVKFKKAEWKLKGGGLFFIGSCFANNLFKTLQDAEIDSQIAPFGNIYNPLSIAEAANLIKGGGVISEKDCIKTKDGYFHFMFHSLKRNKSAEGLTKNLNEEVAKAKKYIKNAEAVIITLGTSFVYKLKDNYSESYPAGRVVNNCHKLSAETFFREQLSIDEAAKALQQTVDYFKTINSNLKIVLTLSPVRHLRDNAVENSLSKAILRCAIDITEKMTNVWYFPSYEIMFDELRDYRWYADDLCHPSSKAVEYIISVFFNSVFSSDYLVFLKKWLKLKANLNHKPLNPDSAEYKNFLAKTLKEMKNLTF